MAYESDKPVAFCFKFARSRDLSKWEMIPGLTFQGTGKEYRLPGDPLYQAVLLRDLSSCSEIRGHNGWVSFLARSKDLASWELSPKKLNPRGRSGRRVQQLRRRPDRDRRQNPCLLLDRRSSDLGRAQASDLPRHDGRVLRELLSRRFAADPGRCPVSSAEARHAHHDFKTARSPRVASIARFR